MSGKVGDLTPKQEEILKEFRQDVADILTPGIDDYCLLRFLRARTFEKKKSEDLLRKHLQWRKEIKADALLTDYIPEEVFLKYYPGGLLGFDKEGCPIRYIPFGSIDFEGFLHSVTIKDYVKYLTSRFEEDIASMKEQSKKRGKVIEQHTYILNMKDFSMKLAVNKKVLELLYQIIITYQDNYPERLKKAFFINASTSFFVAYNVLKPFINENVIRKYHIFGTSGWEEALLGDIDADVLPKFLKGNRVDPDGNENCPSVNKPGGPIPESYYMKTTRHRFCDLPEVQKIVIEANTAYPIEINIEESGSTLKWEFLSIDYDIGMGFFYKSPQSDANMEELIPSDRVDCHLVPHKGKYICEKQGKYILQFDNFHSWFRSKEVVYKTEVELPITHL